jgi:eukaryotic-like serine/threonine-protein kinase
LTEQANLQADAETQAWLQRLRAAGPVPASRGGDLAGGPMPANLISGYELIAEIGRGGQGVVYRALQIQTSRMVALKLLHDGPLASAAAERRFQREIELTTSLDHRGILTVFDAGKTNDGRRYVVCQIVQGLALDQWLEEKQPDLEQRLDVVVQIAEALEHAHQRGVIHLDLKPSNVLVDEKGQACILDFGLARLMEKNVSDSFADGFTAGTPAYMAPEQIRLAPSAWDTRTDVHALGVLLFQSVTEKLPFPSTGTPLEILQAVESQPLPALRSEWVTSARVLRDLEAVCTKAMAKEPDSRYSGAAAFAADLLAMRAGKPMEARGMDRAYRLRLALRRNRAAIAITLASLLLAGWFGWSARVQAGLRADAVESRNQARQAAMAFLEEVDPLIHSLPGAAPARQRIVTRGLEFLQQLRNHTDDVLLAIHLAQGYFLVGNIQADLYSSSSGELGEAIASYQMGLDLLGEVQPLMGESTPAAEQVRRHGVLQFELLRKKGQVLRRMNRWPEYADGTEQSFQLAQQLLDSDADDAEYQHLFALALEDQGVLAGQEERHQDALDLHRRSQAILLSMQLGLEDPERLGRDLAVGHHKIGMALLALGEKEKAHQEFLEFLKQAPKGDGFVGRSDRAIAHEWVGRIEFQMGNPQAAIAHLSQAVAILDALVLDWSDSLRIRTMLATILNHRGEVHLSIQQFEAAKAAFDRFRQTALALVDDYPEVPRNHRFVGVSFYKEFEWQSARRLSLDEQDPQRSQALASARRALEQCISTFQQMEENDLLSPGDAGVLPALQEELQGLPSADAAVKEK